MRAAYILARGSGVLGAVCTIADEDFLRLPLNAEGDTFAKTRAVHLKNVK